MIFYAYENLTFAYCLTYPIVVKFFSLILLMNWFLGVTNKQVDLIQNLALILEIFQTIYSTVIY